VHGIVGHELGFGMQAVFAGRKVVGAVEQYVGRLAVAVVEQHVGDEKVGGQFDRPGFHLEKILQVQSVPGSADPKVSKLVAEAEVQTVAVAAVVQIVGDSEKTVFETDLVAGQIAVLVAEQTVVVVEEQIAAWVVQQIVAGVVGKTVALAEVVGQIVVAVGIGGNPD